MTRSEIWKTVDYRSENLCSGKILGSRRDFALLAVILFDIRGIGLAALRLLRALGLGRGWRNLVVVALRTLVALSRNLWRLVIFLFEDIVDFVLGAGLIHITVPAIVLAFDALDHVFNLVLLLLFFFLLLLLLEGALVQSAWLSTALLLLGFTGLLLLGI